MKIFFSKLVQFDNKASLLFFLVVTACILPLPQNWLGIDYFMVSKKPIILLAGSVLLLSNFKKTIHFFYLELFFILLILFQLISLIWGFSANALLISIFDNVFLFLLLISFTNWINLSSSLIAKLFLVFNSLLVTSLVLFWLQIYIEEGSISMTGYNKVARVFGYNPNYLASLLAISFPIYPLILQKLKSKKLFVYGLITFHILILISLNSRISLFITLATSLLFLININSLKKSISRISILSVVFLCLLLLITVLFQDQQSFFEKLNPFQIDGERLKLWKLTLGELFINSPLLGIGSNSWYLLFPTTDLSSFEFSLFQSKYFTHAHNLFIERLSELGIIGMIPFLLFIFGPAYQFKKLEYKAELIPYFTIYIIYLVLASFYGILYSSITTLSGPTILWFFAISRINRCYLKTFKPKPIRFALANLVLIVLFLSCLFYSAGKFYQHRQYALYKSARSQKDWSTAENKLLKIYNKYLYPNYSDFRNSAEIISRFYAKNNPDKSIFWMKQAVDDQPHNIEYKLGLAKLFFDNQEYEKAKTLYHEVIELNYTILEAYIKLARIGLAEKDPKDFEQYLEFPKIALDGLFTSKEINISKGYLNEENIRFWKNMEGLKLEVERLEEEAIQVFKNK